MAYIARVKGHNGKRSPYWHVFWWDAEGRQHNKSLRTRNRDEALTLCEGSRAAARLAKAGRLTAESAREVITHVVNSIAVNWSGSTLHSYTLRSWITVWLKSKESEISPSTLARYTGLLKRLCAFLNHAADRDLAGFTAEEATRFRDELVATLSPSTAKLAVKSLKACFNDAVARGLIASSPVRSLRPPKVARGEVRRAFTQDEIKRLLKHADAEWRGMILFGLYTGQRLGDVRSWTWRHVNIERRTLRFIAAKTGVDAEKPLADVLVDYLATMPAPDDLDAPLFPRACAVSKVSTLSRQFHELMADAGLVAVQTHAAAEHGKGRAASRNVSAITFHSLRHTLTTWLDSNASPAVSSEMVGHTDAAVHRGYSHIETETIRAALNKLPDVTRR